MNIELNEINQGVTGNPSAYIRTIRGLGYRLE